MIRLVILSQLNALETRYYTMMLKVAKKISIASCEDIEYIELLKVDKLLFRKDYLKKILEII